jgi:NAD(P)-dependent dehydrogenase (short-subunit alcohol dehydrogenase family)
MKVKNRFKVCIVVGVSRGFGLEIARQLAKAGARDKE